ncbi:MAG: alpha/beta hydrolase [Deltaproteobacteria bacterium]|nr:alpha/beta hydrolase [Deltaproteobacteria bacterium]
MSTPSLRTRLRKQLGAAVVDGFFRGASKLGSLHPNARPERHGVAVTRDVAYGSLGPPHTLDIYRPRDARGPLPVVLYIHGGGFRILSKDTHWVMGLAFARQGYLVFNVNYRLAPEHPFPAAFEDVCEAYRWVVEHATEYGGDLGRLVVAGESAGANLTSSLTLATCFRREEPSARRVFETGVVPRAWLPYCGVLQVSDIERLRRRWPHMSEFITDRLVEVSLAYVGDEPERHGASLELADPLCVLEGEVRPERPLPPCFATCGTRDPLVADTQRLAAALASRAVPHEAHYYPGELHAFHALVWRPHARRCWRDTFRFLDEHCAP